MTQNALTTRPDHQVPAAPGMREVLTRITDEFSRVWFHRGFGLFLAWCVVIVAALIALALPDRYNARAQIYVNTDSLLRPLLKGLAIAPNLEQQVAVLQKTLLTDVNLSKVLLQLDEDLKGADRAEFASAIEDLRSQIRVDGIGNELFSISYDGIVPDRARQVVQSLLTIFIESNLGQSRTDMQTARDFVDQQIARYETQLREADQRLAQFRIEHVGIVGQQISAERLEAARTVLEDATIDLQGARDVRKILEERLASTEAVMGADTPPPQIVVGDQLIVTAIDRINTLRAQLQGLSLRYTDDHPDVIATRDALNALVKQYSGGGDRQYASNRAPAKKTTAKAGDTAAVAAHVGTAPSTATLSAVPSSTALKPTLLGVLPKTEAEARSNEASSPVPSETLLAANNNRPAGRNETQNAVSVTPNPEYGEIQVQLLKTKFAILEGEQKVARAQVTLSTLQAEAKIAPPVEAELSELTRGYDVMKKNYLELLASRESARMSQAVDTSVDVVQFRIVEPPVVPAKPSGPNRSIFLLIGTLIAIAGGGLGAFVRGTLHDAVISERDLHSAFGLPVIATIGPSGGMIGRFRYSLQWLSLLVSIIGIIVTMLMIGYFSPYLEPLRLTVYQIINDTLHLWS